MTVHLLHKYRMNKLPGGEAFDLPAKLAELLEKTGYKGRLIVERQDGLPMDPDDLNTIPAIVAGYECEFEDGARWGMEPKDDE